MRKNLFLVGVIIITIVGILIYKNLGKILSKIRLTHWALKKGTTMPEKNLENKKIAMIIAFRDFKDEEYLIPKEILENADAEIITVSDKTGTAISAGGSEANVDITIENLNINDFDAIVFIGGQGALSHLDNEKSYEIAKQAVEKDKILGAICISPVILAKSGVLRDKKATVWSSPLDRGPIKILEQNGAIYEDKKVVIDGKIITANGPAAAKEFGEKLVKGLTPTPYKGVGVDKK